MDILTILNFLTKEECDNFIELTRKKEAPKFNDSGNFTNKKWIDNELSQFFYDRLNTFIINDKYKRANNVIMSGSYKEGDSFSLHTDTGLYYNRNTKEKSRWTLLVYLNEDFDGGDTIFYDTNTWKEVCRIKPEIGKVLIFDIDLWHKGEQIRNGFKHWIGCELIGDFISVV